MTVLATNLHTRRDEFDAHFDLAVALENRMILEPALDNVNLSARHINTIKSGLIVHLYNIEEAIMTEAMQLLGNALGSADPRRWTECSLREWLRETIVGRTAEGNEDSRLKTVFQMSTRLLKETNLGPQQLKKPSGTWDDKVIASFLDRMDVSFSMPAEMWTRIAATPKYGDKTPLQFLAGRRNAIAHGRRSFENGASDLALPAIRDLADVTLDYLEYVVQAIQQHVIDEAHLVAAP
jgi:MAE_28990/MAE_18760-like HEPN